MTTRDKSKEQEDYIASLLGMKRTSNSGATKFWKGDVLGEDILIECKTCMTEKKSFSISKEWLEKNKEEAFQMGKTYNALAFNFGDNRKNYFVIDEDLFRNLVCYLESVKC